MSEGVRLHFDRIIMILSALAVPLAAGARPADDLAPYLDTSYRQYGASPDCGETPFTYDDLIKHVQSPQVTDQISFLTQLPAGVMQTFTLMHESNSLQFEAISPSTPGIIRMSQDGKLTIRYVCDRTQEHVYNKIEVMRFDEREAQFKFSEISFDKPRKERVTESPRVCFSCHNQKEDVGDPRPNWEMYPEWPGAFGSHDDFFPLGTADEAVMVHHATGWLPPNRSEEKSKFDLFRQRHLSPPMADPCYSTLPWLKNAQGVEKFANYPYDIKNGHAQTRIYGLRPNLKLTEIYSHLLGVRNARRLQRAPQYDDLKRLLAVESARCLDEKWQESPPGTNQFLSTQDFHKYLNEVLSQYAKPADLEAQTVILRGIPYTYFDPRHVSSRAQGMYGVSIALGFAPGDWALSFGDPTRAVYETGAGPGKNRDYSSDLPLSAYVQHEILQDVMRLHPDLNGSLSRSTGESDDFGQHFSCIDKIAGASVWSSEKARADSCAVLVRDALDYRKVFLSRPRTRQPPPVPPGPRYPRPFVRGEDNFQDWLRRWGRSAE